MLYSYNSMILASIPDFSLRVFYTKKQV